MSREFQVPVVLMVAPHRCEVYRIQGPKAVHCHVWAKRFVHTHYAGRLLPGGGSSVHTVENDSQGQGIWKCVVRGLDHVSVSSRSCLVVSRIIGSHEFKSACNASFIKVLEKTWECIGADATITIFLFSLAGFGMRELNEQATANRSRCTVQSESRQWQTQWTRSTSRWRLTLTLTVRLMFSLVPGL